MTTTTETKTVTFNGPLGVKPLLSYVDPHPGLHGQDRISFTERCDRCSGTGVYRWWTSYGQAAGTCFKCFGTGRHTYDRAVVTIRKEAKADAYYRDYADEIAAHRELVVAAERAQAEAEAVEQAAAEFAAAWDAAHAEQERRAALNQNTIGEVDERLRNLDAVIKVSSGYERPKFSGYGTEYIKVVTAELEDGRVVMMKGTAASLYGLDRGDRVRITGTVKEHAVYKKTGQMQTVLKRPVVEVVERAGQA